MSEVLGLQSVVVRKNDLPNTAVDSDLVILNLATNNYVGLDDIGRRIWEALEQPCRVEDLCKRLAGEYSDSSGQITNDVLAFLNELLAEGLLRVSER